MSDSASDIATAGAEAFYGDTRDDLLASAADKQSNALGHFNYFRKTYRV